jgi:hypothetical protein
MLPEITRRLRVPRALSVPFSLGYPLGKPDDPVVQTALLRELLALCGESDGLPRLEASAVASSPRSR